MEALRRHGPWRIERYVSAPETGPVTISAGKGFGRAPDRKENLKQAPVSRVQDPDQRVVTTIEWTQVRA